MPKFTFALVLAVGAAASAFLVRPVPAQACSCSRPGVEVSPGAGMAAPTNTVVRVSWWIDMVKIDETTLQILPASAAAKSKKAKKGKKKKDEDKGEASATIELERTGFSSAQQRFVTLRPKAPLAPETRYEVHAASAAGEKLGVVGEFTTGANSDEKPPEWAGVGKAAFVHKPAICCDCSTGDPYVQIDLTDAGKTSDDVTALPALVYGVWLDDGSQLEPGAAPAQAPILLARAWSGKLYLGHKSQCAPVNFGFPAKLPATLKLRVAPIDLAGHVGKVVSLSVDVPKPKEAAKPPANQ